MIGTRWARYDNLNRFFDGYIAPYSILCHSTHGYEKLAVQLDLEYKAISSGKHVKGIYHIQHINTLHSNFKDCLQKFRDSSIKRLSSYLKWFKWIELFKDEKELLTIQKAYVQSQASCSLISNKKIRTKEPLFFYFYQMWCDFSLFWI